MLVALVIGMALLQLTPALAGIGDAPSRPRTPTRTPAPARKFLQVLPDSYLEYTCPGEGAILELEGRLALVPIVARGRPVYRVVEAEFRVSLAGHEGYGTMRGEGMFWPALPGGIQRLVLDFPYRHYDSNYYSFQQHRNLQFELWSGGICDAPMYLHLASADGLDPSMIPSGNLRPADRP